MDQSFLGLPRYLMIQKMQPEAQPSVSSQIIADLKAGVTNRGAASLVVCGGTSPLDIFDDLAQCFDLPWEHITVTLADDRLVGADHADSNERLVTARLLKGNAAQFVSLARCPEQALALPRPFDVVLLGMGRDGHIASLFPAMMTTHPHAFDAAAAPAILKPGRHGSPAHPRVTMTLSLLLETRRLILLLSDQAKQDIFDQARQGAEFPISPLLKQNKIPIDIVRSNVFL